MAQHLKTGDKVVIIAGDNKGKSGKIVKLDLKSHKAFIEDIEVRERHLKKTQYNPAGGKKTIHVGIDLSNLKKEGK
ncbi:KOW motif-containing protein [Candidatus Saccharibacteria bacterium]|nr:KOW motif-containing protein [Candidatus Saccharibacteria bacterium]